MKKSFLMFAMLFVFGTVFTVTSCRDQKKNDNKVEKAMDDTGDAIDKAVDKTGDAIDKAADKTGEAVDKAADTVKKHVK